jgi:hypothetical protein
MARFTVTWDKEVEMAFIDEWVAGDSRMRKILNEVAK